MSEQFNKTFKLGDDRSRTHIPGFNIPDFKVERFNGEPLLAHLFLKHLSDVIDSDKCAYIFDKHHELADVSHLERIQVRDEDRRKRELIAHLRSVGSKSCSRHHNMAESANTHWSHARRSTERCSHCRSYGPATTCNQQTSRTNLGAISTSSPVSRVCIQLTRAR